MSVTLDSKKWVLANIYTPNKDTPEFFKVECENIDKFMMDFKLIGGDFNLAIDPIMDRWGTIYNNNSAKWLRSHFENISITDVWRSLNTDQPGYTWRKVSPKPTFSRLDYLFISENALQFINSIQLQYAFRSDHSIVELTFNPVTTVRGPGYWKFNNALLHDRNYTDRINDLIEIELHNSVESSPPPKLGGNS